MSDINSVIRLVKSVWPLLDVTELIGQGPDGAVYRAVGGGAVCAIKVIRVPQNPDEIVAVGQNDILRERAKAGYAATLEALCNTVRVQQLLACEPNILTIREYVTVPCENGIGSYVLINMECLNSVDRLGEYSALQAIQLGIDVLSALEVCERSYVRHGNIKPSNIFVSELGVYKLGDIGISQVLGTSGAAQLYRSCFTAPEVMNGSACDIRSDIYSVGALMYFVLGDRKLPFYIRNGHPLAPSREMTQELNMLLATACADNPTDRYADASTMKQELINLYTSMVFGNRDSANAGNGEAEAAVFGAQSSSAFGTAEESALEQSDDHTSFADSIPADIADTASQISVSDDVIGVNSDGSNDKNTDNMLKSIFGDCQEGSLAVSSPDTEETLSVRHSEPVALGSAVRSIAGDTTPSYVPAGSEVSYDEPTVSTSDAAATAVFTPLGDTPLSMYAANDGVRGQQTLDSVQENRTMRNPGAPRKTAKKVGKHVSHNEKGGSKAIIIVSATIALLVLIVLGFAAYFVVESIRGMSFVGYAPDDENAPPPESISILTLPDKVEYYRGESLDITGLTVEAKYDYFRKAEITEGFTVKDTVFYNEGQHEIEVSYKGVVTEFTVNVLPAALNELKIVRQPHKRDYILNQELDFTGLELAAYYSDGKVLKIADGYDVSTATADEIGTQTVTVTYGMKTVNFQINVSEKTVEAISIKKLPDRLEYAQGEYVDTTGLLLNVTYNTGISATVSTDITATPTKLEELGTQTVIISYGGIKTAYEVTVTEAVPIGIKVNETRMPNQLSYVKGDEISLDGIGLLEVYNNGEEKEITEGYTFYPTVAETVGAQIVTVEYGGFSTTFNVVVENVPVRSISIQNNPAVREYHVNDTVYTYGMVLYVVYEDGTTKEITGGYTYSPTEVSSVGQTYINVRYGGKSTGYNVDVYPEGAALPGKYPVSKSVSSVTVKKYPKKLSYGVGDTIYTSGLTLTVKYSDGTTKDITGGFTYSPTTVSKVGRQYITVSYGGKSTGYYVDVSKNSSSSVSSLSIKKEPLLTDYKVGDTIYVSGITVRVTYADGSTKDITGGFTYSPTTVTKEGKQYITVSYGGKSTGYYVNVTSLETPTSLVVKKLPTKTEYSVGDTIDTTGLELTATYTNGSSKTVTSGYKLSKTTLDSTGTVLVTVSYNGASTSFAVYVRDNNISASGKLTQTLNWSLSDSTLTISGSGQMQDFIYRGAPWQSYALEIKSIVIEDGVLSISSNAFVELSAETISIPASVTVIHDDAIYSCRKLNRFSVASGNRAFAVQSGVLYSKDLKKLLAYPVGRQDTTFTIPSTTEVIDGYRVFAGSPLTEVIITEKLYMVDQTAFYGATNIEKITVRQNNKALTSVDGVLYNKSMSELICYPAAADARAFVVPDTVRFIRAYAFAENRSLENISLPAGIKEINNHAFYGVTSLDYVYYNGTEKNFDNVFVGIGNDSFGKAKITFNG